MAPHQSTRLTLRFLLGVCLAVVYGESSPHASRTEIEELASYILGSYSNSKQYYALASHGLPANKPHLFLRASFYKLEKALFNSSVTVFYQDFTKSSSTPFDSGFYCFSPAKDVKAIRMRILRIRSGVLRAPQRLKGFDIADVSYIKGLPPGGELKESDFLTHSSCDMMWKKVATTTFVGITGAQCLASLGKDKVRISVSMTLTPTKLMLTEGWYKVKDGTRLSDSNIPYILSKTSGPKLQKPGLLTSTNRSNNKLSREARSHRRLKPNSRLTKRNLETFYRPNWTPNSTVKKQKTKRFLRQNVERSRTIFNDSGRKTSSRHLARKGFRSLRNFRQITTALTSGHDLHFDVDLSSCQAPKRARVDRLSFGGKVTHFLYARNVTRARKDYVYFVSRNTVMGSAGPEYITRGVTLLRGGRVEVRVTKTFADHSRVPSKYIYQCRISNQKRRTSQGSVRVSVTTSSTMREVSNFRSIKSLLGQGRDLRLVLGLSHCQGSKGKSSVVIGTSITEYDMINRGKTIEVFLPVSFPFRQTLSAYSPRASDLHLPSGFTGRIFQTGDVILTQISSHRTNWHDDKDLHISNAYQCKMSGGQADWRSNEYDDHGVGFFYAA